jgi:hypothetical protein
VSRGRPIAWLMLAVWASWLSAAQGLIVAKSFFGSWTPDLGLLLLIACAGRLHRRDVPLATLVVALGRVAHTVEPPAAVLAGFLGASLLCQSVRRLAEIGRPLMRCGLAGGGALLLPLWFAAVDALRAGRPAAGALLESLPGALAGALSTAVVGLLFMGSLVHLPGLTPLRERKW